MKQTHFVIDAFGEQSFEGFSEGEHWNGWACPYFPFEEGQRIVKTHNANEGKGWFDPDGDQFVFQFQDETEFYPAVLEGGEKLYPIGNRVWTWEENND